MGRSIIFSILAKAVIPEFRRTWPFTQSLAQPAFTICRTFLISLIVSTPGTKYARAPTSTRFVASISTRLQPLALKERGRPKHSGARWQRLQEHFSQIRFATLAFGAYIAKAPAHMQGRNQKGKHIPRVGRALRSELLELCTFVRRALKPRPTRHQKSDPSTRAMTLNIDAIFL